MKAKLSLFLFTMLLCASMAFAVNGSAYYVLRSNGYNSYILTQETYGCSPYSYGYGYSYNNCIASVRDTPADLAQLLKDNWAEPNGIWNSVLVLGSDIDLGEFDATTKTGSCTVNHIPLFHPYMGSIDGKGYTIRNLCFSGTADRPMGLFSTFRRGNVSNLKISGIRLYISGSSTSGKDYYPVGAFAGVIDSSHVSNVTLANDSIDAPFAGGFAGLVSNCTIENVSGDDDIRITNTTVIKNGYAGSSLLGDSYGFNAYLGGIAGVTIRDNKDDVKSYYRDSVKVDVLDLATGHKSAVGGISGVLASSGASVANVTVFTKKKIDGKILKSHIAGGSAMGGLFGFLSVNYRNQSAEEGVISLSKSKFEGVIGDGSTAVSGDTVGFVSMGGLIGRDSILALSALKIDTSSAIVDIADSVKVSGNFRYMVGGLLGSSSKCNNSQNDSSYVFIKGSKASGKIDIAGSGTAVNNLHVQTFVGGIAGYACLASGTNGMKNDTSSVSINVRTKTGFGLVSNGAAVFDTIGVGGLVGYVNNPSEMSLKFYKDVFNGNIVIQDSLNTVSAGGMVGAYPEANGGKSIAFESVVVKSENVIEVTSAKAAVVAKGYNDKQVNRLGGLCGYCRAVSGIAQASVSGNILGKGSFAGDSVLIGGFVGNVYTGDNLSLKIQSSYMKGDIVVSNVDESKVNAGYIWGSGVIFGGYDIKSIYHYSEVDEVEPFGVFYTGSYVADKWKTNQNIGYVIRNSETQKELTPLEQNGFKTAENMKKSAFAGFLNEKLDPYGWSYEKGTNDDLPFPVDASHAAVAPGSVITYTVNFMDFDGKLLSTQIVREGYPAMAPDEPERDGHDFIGWDKAFDNVETNLTVKAQYKAHRFYVIFHNENGDTLSGFFTPASAGDEGNFVEYGTAVDAPGAMYAELLAKEGYVFVGWDDSTYNYVTKNMDIYPVYKLNEFSVRYVNEKDELVFEKKFHYGEELVVADSAVKAADDSTTYVFEKWTLENGDELPATMPASDLVLVPVFKEIRKTYTVVFLDFDGKQIRSLDAEYGAAVNAPETPVSAGRVFTEWSDSSYQKVVKNLVIEAVYDTVTFKLTFLDYRDSVYYEGTFKYNADMSVAKALERQATDAYNYTFKFWSSVENPEEILGVLKSDMVVKAVYDSTLKIYSVTYKDFDGSVIGDVQKVGYGQSAVAPADPSREGYDFTGWTEDGSAITKDIVIYALYNTAESSSSSSELSSSSVEIKLVSPKFDVSGNAVRLTYNTENADSNTMAQVILLGADGTSIDTLLDASAINGGVWKMEPIPSGLYSAKVVLLDNEGAVLDSFVNPNSIEVISEITVSPKSWRMISAAALENSLLESSDAVFYWWDERNPVGDYWQYRAYAGGDIDETRGFWYGSIKGGTFSFKPAVERQSDEIVWNLDSLYSGWNLVANPYGWYIDLQNGKTDNGESVAFWKWSAEDGYVPATFIAPYEAVWAEVKSATTFRVSSAPMYGQLNELPAEPAKKITALRKGVARKASASNWSLAVSLVDERGKCDSWNVLGVGNMAETMGEPPAGMGERVSLAIRETANGDKLAKSIKTASDSYEWILDVNADEARDGKISIDGIENLNSLGLSLFVTSDGVTKELKNGESLPVALKKTSQKIAVRVAAAGANIVTFSGLNGFKAAQNANELVVGFDASRDFAGANGHYVLVSVNGKKVASGNFTAAAGSNVLNMDAPKSGLYFMQVKVGSQVMNAKVMVK